MNGSFRIFAPMALFEKADAPEGQRRRIAGVISTEKLDKQGEIVVQKGLDFSPFQKEGYWNDNHSKKTADILGEPDGEVKFFQKGQKLPDGETAEHNCSWAEGYLYDTADGDRIWKLGMSMKKSGAKRRLGFSIEGTVQKRTGPGNRIVAKAVVRNVAITNCPVGEGTRLEVLAKSMVHVEAGDDDAAEKALTMGGASPGTSVATTGPHTGDGAGAVTTPESLEQDGQAHLNFSPRKKRKDDEPEAPQLSKAEAMVRIWKSLGCTMQVAEQVYATFERMKATNKL